MKVLFSFSLLEQDIRVHVGEMPQSEPPCKTLEDGMEYRKEDCYFAELE